MTKYPDMIAYPHGTPARARWHYRRGHKPLRKHCVQCADAAALDKAMREEKKNRERS